MENLNLDKNTVYDMVIVGCGPGGLSAAVNAKIREKKILVFGGDHCLTKVGKAPRIDNYLGHYQVAGHDLRERFFKHAEELGILVSRERIDNIYPVENLFQLMIKGEVYSCKSVILATGLSVPDYLPGEKELLGKGVGYCATCDGPLYKGKNVILVGETVEGQEEANFLSDICESVIYISLHGEPNKLKKKVIVGKGKPIAIKGKDHFEALETEEKVYEAHGLFLIRQVTPVQEIIPGLELEDNFIKIDKNMATNIPGVYAAGDCTGPPYLLPKAVGDGAAAAINAVRYIDDQSLEG